MDTRVTARRPTRSSQHSLWLKGQITATHSMRILTWCIPLGVALRFSTPVGSVVAGGVIRSTFSDTFSLYGDGASGLTVAGRSDAMSFRA